MIHHMIKPKACLFDLDGVLIDSEPLHGKAWTLTAKTFNFNLTGNQLKLLQGRTRVDCAKLLQDWIGKSINFKELIDIHQPISRKMLSEAKPMPGAKVLVEWCYQNRIPLALVTSSSNESMRNKIKPHPWIELIPTKIVGDHALLSKGKPSPDPYLLASQELNVDPKDCWVIEDSISGTQSANAAGCTVWVLNNEGEEIKNTTSSSRVKHIKHLVDLLKELKGFNQ